MMYTTILLQVLHHLLVRIDIAQVSQVFDPQFHFSGRKLQRTLYATSPSLRSSEFGWKLIVLDWDNQDENPKSLNHEGFFNFLDR